MIRDDGEIPFLNTNLVAWKFQRYIVYIRLADKDFDGVQDLFF